MLFRLFGASHRTGDHEVLRCRGPHHACRPQKGHLSTPRARRQVGTVDGRGVARSAARPHARVHRARILHRDDRDPHILGPFWIPLLAFVAYVAPMAALDRKAQSRQEQIRRMLADTIDLLTISVEAGLAFDAALLHARRSMKGPLSEEIGRMLHEMQLGSNEATRCGTCPIGPMSRSCEASCSPWCKPTSRGQRGERAALPVAGATNQATSARRGARDEGTPVKLLFPMIICILPALLVLVVGPGAIRIAHVLF